MFILKIRTALIILGDAVSLYTSLIITLLIRYGTDGFSGPFYSHFKPFSFIFIVWFLIFYLFDLYQERFFKHSPATAQTFSLAVSASIVASIIIFYAFEPFFRLTPKTNLLIFGLIFGISNYFLRLVLARLFISGGWRKKIIFIGDSPIFASLAEYIKNNPQAGYNINLWLKKLSEEKFSNLIESIKKNEVEMAIVDAGVKNNHLNIKFIYRLLPLEIKIMDLSRFYETIFQKVPLEEIKESWFIEEITLGRRFYDMFKRTIDLTLSLILNIILLPIIIIIALLVKISSEGSVIYKQERIGKNNRPFILYKFRTMKIDETGPLWTDKNDPRLTFFGKIIRWTHLDELPQLFNILKGDISFIGPRPERTELTDLYKKLPYYEIRHTIKPGLTGWAQVNYKPSASLKEAREKLQYDFYYIKNRSLILDLLILLKTVRYLFLSHQ
ncbi:MAG: exopolysaccharide biosynthesis polyprenyl glycosylphosphotransferase [Patescibacteria group bacterium]